ncbi:flavin-nucleotide-binding protein [Coniochaeta ligniaria NRRL 30616]|uniref:Flavin-nucleotide-binding protein n=1 Tax=Coniochaeta ligniaria NRRL 30616 TaxID=1408157 RepID=A0A1J7J5E3_9PEZI|nr:flavin-nucleotide-binding protein [Coniochaeta ligniaria NRRL 30616]
MVRYELEYPKQPYSTVKRYDSLASYSLSTIHTIIATSPLVNVSFNPPNSPFPTILPMIGALGSYARPSADITDVQDLYLHGYVSSRIMNLSRTPDQPDGLPVCISATHLDGLVLTLTPNSHNYNYRSATLFGHATLVTDRDEKLFAMRRITDGVVPGRWEGSRVPPNAGEMASTSVLRVKIAAGSAKVRAGGPTDDKGDMSDEALKDRVWTGVVPVYQTLGTPLAGEYNRVEVPGYIAEYVRDSNVGAQEQAVEAAKATVVPKKVVDE